MIIELKKEEIEIEFEIKQDLESLDFSGCIRM